MQLLRTFDEACNQPHASKLLCHLQSLQQHKRRVSNVSVPSMPYAPASFRMRVSISISGNSFFECVELAWSEMPRTDQELTHKQQQSKLRLPARPHKPLSPPTTTHTTHMSVSGSGIDQALSARSHMNAPAKVRSSSAHRRWKLRKQKPAARLPARP